MYRSVLLSALSSVALLPSAFAADIYSPAPPPAYAAVALPPSWSGFYIGANGGYGGNSGIGFREDESFATLPNANFVNPVSTLFGADTITGGFGGGQLGYNFQFGSFVLGLETDIEGSNIQGSGANAIFNPSTLAATTTPTSPVCLATATFRAGSPGGGCAARNDLDVDWFGTVRGRLGYALGNTLIYATGGFAYGGVRSAFSYTDNATGVIATKSGTTTIATGTHGTASSSTTQTGWVAGAGIEYKIAPNWTLKGEYQYIDLGSATASPGETSFNTPLATTPTVASCATTFPGCLSLRGRTEDVAFNTVRIGVNYLFNAAPEPLPLK
jgi:outer membrane immunogenic protein